MQWIIFSISYIHGDNKSNKKQSCKNPLTSCEHIFKIFNKFNQMTGKVVICIIN